MRRTRETRKRRERGNERDERRGRDDRKTKGDQKRKRREREAKEIVFSVVVMYQERYKSMTRYETEEKTQLLIFF